MNAAFEPFRNDDHLVLANGVFYGRMHGRDFTMSDAHLVGVSMDHRSEEIDIATRSSPFKISHLSTHVDVNIEIRALANMWEPKKVPPQIITVGDVTLMDVFQFANGMVDDRS